METEIIQHARALLERLDDQDLMGDESPCAHADGSRACLMGVSIEKWDGEDEAYHLLIVPLTDEVDDPRPAFDKLSLELKLSGNVWIPSRPTECSKSLS